MSVSSGKPVSDPSTIVRLWKTKSRPKPSAVNKRDEDHDQHRGLAPVAALELPEIGTRGRHLRSVPAPNRQARGGGAPPIERSTFGTAWSSGAPWKYSACLKPKLLAIRLVGKLSMRVLSCITESL